MDKKTEMSFLDHLEIFRWHLIRSIIAVFLFSVIAFIFKNIIFDIILLAPKNSSFPTYVVLCSISDFLGLGDFFCLSEIPFSLININMSGQFAIHIKASIFAGFIMSFPYVFWEFWRFVSPALYDNEQKLARRIVFFSSFLFIVGVLFGYYIIAPLAVNFLGAYQISSLVDNQISINSFISTIMTVCLANGFIFELPILVYFLTKIGLLTPDLMRTYRKHAMVITLILSAIITPPDIISQILVSLPLVVLYEISIGISARIIQNSNKS